MFVVVATCAALVILTTFIHYEVLRALSAGLPKLTIATRAKLMVVIFGTFLAHAAEVFLYALAIYAIAWHGALGSLGEPGPLSFHTFLYFSAETFTSLGYGDVLPRGTLRLVAGVEALNGLLLIGWSASFAYIAMERFWAGDGAISDQR